MLGTRVAVIALSSVLALSNPELSPQPPVRGVCSQLVKSLKSKPIKKKKKVQKKKAKDKDVELLAHLIFAEVGSDYIPDKVLETAGAVVINRMHDKDLKGDNLHDVIYTKGQFDVVRTGAIKKKPTKRCYTIARHLLEDGVKYYDVPSNVVYFAEWKQGSGVYYKWKNVIFSYK